MGFLSEGTHLWLRRLPEAMRSAASFLEFRSELNTGDRPLDMLRVWPRLSPRCRWCEWKLASERSLWRKEATMPWPSSASMWLRKAKGAAKSKRQSEARSQRGSTSWKSTLTSIGSSTGSGLQGLTVSGSLKGSRGPNA